MHIHQCKNLHTKYVSLNLKYHQPFWGPPKQWDPTQAQTATALSRLYKEEDEKNHLDYEGPRFPNTGYQGRSLLTTFSPPVAAESTCLFRFAAFNFRHLVCTVDNSDSFTLLCSCHTTITVIRLYFKDVKNMYNSLQTPFDRASVTFSGRRNTFR